jgi:hypothetical protein
VSLISVSDSDPEDVEEAEEDDEAARLFRFRLRFLAGAFAAATRGIVVDVDEPREHLLFEVKVQNIEHYKSNSR